MSEELAVRVSPPARVSVTEARQSVTVRAATAPTLLGAHLGQLADAVEVLDGGILVAAEDIAGGVRVQVDGSQADLPPDGVSWSTPLRRPDGALHGALTGSVRRFPLIGSYGLEELTAWTTKATPSGGAIFCGVLDGPMSSATNGVVCISHNGQAGEQRIGWLRLNAGSWGNVSWGSYSDQSGADLAVGQGWGGSTSGYGFCVVPREGQGTIPERVISGAATHTLTAGATPHLVWGVFQPDAAGPGGVIEFAPLVEAWPARLPVAR